MVMFLSFCRVIMSGLLWMCMCEVWHAARIALRMLWYIFRCCFQSFCCFLGKNNP